jgi:hypothetical protein
MQSTCVDDPCAIPATGVAPGYGDKRGTFHWDAANWDDGVLRSEIDYEDTCVKNGTDEVLVQHGFDVVAKIALSPVVIVDGEVLAWKGTFSSVGTPTAEATAASAEDCFRFYESEAAAASTTQPYFHGL